MEVFGNTNVREAPKRRDKEREALDLVARVCKHRIMIRSQGVGRCFALRILAVVMLAMTIACFFLPSRTPAAGVTIITHGHSGEINGWVIGMAASIPYYPYFPGTNVVCYEMKVTYNNGYFVTPIRLGGASLASDPYAEIVVKLDWSDLAGTLTQFDTESIATVVVPRLLQSGYIAELNGHALSELPLHLIGHSRGGSLVCAMSKLLGMQGVWVDQVTTLDPHPVNNNGNTDLLLSVVDAPLGTYQNVLFADNYYQTLGIYPNGQSISTAFNRRLTSFPHGYYDIFTLTPEHANAHLWYHSTIDLYDPAYDREAYLHGAHRSGWYTAAETNGYCAGYFYSRVGGGDRLSTIAPAGSGTGQIRDGYNQLWEAFGAGVSGNRYALPSNNGSWPNLIRFDLLGSNSVAQGETALFKYFIQNLQAATVSIFLDDDYNPYNGSVHQIGQIAEPAITASQIRYPQFPFDTTTAAPRSYTIFAKITAGGNSRYLYAPEILTIRPVPCSYTIAPSGRSHSSGAGSGSVNVTAGTTCAWTATSNNDWINVTAGASGMGNGTVFYAVQLNPELTGRTGTVTVAESTFTVIQAGLPPDITRPMVLITAPLPSALFTNDHVVLIGQATDDRGLARVEYQFGTNEVMVADGTNSWTATLELLPGTNTVRVWSRDLAGNISTTNTRSFFFSRVPLAKGAYNGLFHQADGFHFGTSGSFKLVVTDKYTYSGSLVSGGKAYSMSGKINPDGTATNLVARSGTNSLLVIWLLDVGSLDKVTGTVNGGDWQADLSGDRAVYNAKTNPARQTGKFTFTIAGQTGATDAPEGDGFGTAIVDGNGKVKVSGILAEGTKFTQIATLSADSRWPLFAPLYANKGSVVSWISFDSMQTNQFGGVLNWFKPSLAASKYYTNGFAITNVALGSRYVAPIGATNRILSITDSSVIFSGGNRLASITNAVILGLSSKVTNASPNKLTLTFAMPSGLFTGTLVETGTVKKVVFKGAVLQSLNCGSGFFLGTNQSGRVSFQSAP